jgi:hypothetical protein
MAFQRATVVPELYFDDGAVFAFTITDSNGNGWICGFMHRPFHAYALKLSGGMMLPVTPPVTWADYDNLDSWVETLKYGARNNKTVQVVFDDQISISYTSWTANVPPHTYSGTFDFQQVYGVTG